MRWKDNGLALHKHIISAMGSHEQGGDVCRVAVISWCTAGHSDSLILWQGRWLER